MYKRQPVICECGQIVTAAKAEHTYGCLLYTSDIEKFKEMYGIEGNIDKEY